MLTQIRTINAPGAITAPHTTRVYVLLKTGEEWDEGMELMLTETETIDLLLINDGQPCRPKIDAVIAAEYPGCELLNWWTPEPFDEF